ncbi:glycerophosphoryl diester phosphodiesterase [Lachnotalea glycerini]|uniref:Glycerophosphoryl diester phosphodiesterase n=1 Tax=Lachnotalea glycerini TaxID=1763509 RepID=A0A255IJ74_9FIRM|nr:glycerophosphodiester phosphodiesterase family protein [Lachnotalea glycerini]PXV90179.1 glycerophosphoryl diester phosphodiesterase [Lachnotalea glycerini]RDY31761.1 hypothetical protein CG710_007915 [Lachnotalea glycerini]
MKKYRKKLVLFVIGILVIAFVTGMFWVRQPYYKKYHYVAHALGGIDGLEYTNSKEALEYSYSMGNRLMEIDFLYTSDGKLVCRHKWSDDFKDGFSNENIPDYETFMSSKIYGIYTPLDLEAVLQFARDNPDVYFITDTKLEAGQVIAILESIEEAAEKIGYTDYKRQFVIQFYNYENYEQIRERFSFENYIFTLYHMKSELRENGIDNILDFCVEKNIKVLTIPQKYITKEICKKLKKNGITVFVHTIDSRKSVLELRFMGVNGVYSNYVYPYKMLRLILAMLLLLLIMAAILFALIYFLKTVIKVKKLSRQ